MMIHEGYSDTASDEKSSRIPSSCSWRNPKKTRAPMPSMETLLWSASRPV